MAVLTQHAPPSQAAARQLRARLPFMLVLGVLLGAADLRAQDRHYQLKAAFIANFAQYVEWPPNAFATNDATIVFGILGENPFGDALKTLLEGEVVNGRRATVRHFRSISEVGRCHVLFIADSERNRLPAIMRSLRGRSILTVSDLERFNNEGGVIRFITDTRVRFRVNVAAAQAGGLTISSKLLRLAAGVDSADRK